MDKQKKYNARELIAYTTKFLEISFPATGLWILLFRACRQSMFFAHTHIELLGTLSLLSMQYTFSNRRFAGVPLVK